MRLNLILFLFILSFGGVVARLFYVQMLHNEDYLILAEKQRTISSEIPAERGRIFSSEGDVLASNEEAYLLFGDPQKINDPEEIAKKIVPILIEDERFFSYNPLPTEPSNPPTPDALRWYLFNRLKSLLSNRDLRWVLLARKISTRSVEALKSLKLEGLGFEPDPRRFYPEGILSASLLGFVASDESGEDKGYSGLEGHYDGDLRGKSGKSVHEYSAAGEPILVGASQVVVPQDGADLYLTIDRGVQSILERKIKEGVERYQAKSGSFVALETKTGRVLAMGNYPSFDPGNFSARGGPDNPPELRNLSIAATYEPGSIMKSVTIAAALDSGKIDPLWTFVDEGPLRIGGAVINTWDGKHWGQQNLSELLQKSNNIGAAQLALAAGRETLRNYFLNFGFGSDLGIDLEGEEAGLVKELKDWRQTDLANAGFGQGVAVTVLQMASAYATIANGGVLMKPYVVEKITDANGREARFSPEPIKRVISQKTSELSVELLRVAVESGESLMLRNFRYRVAGKTGTAQIPAEGKYDPTKANATFIGFFLKDRPFVMIIRLEEPTTSTFSALTAVPLWMEAAAELAPLFGITPDK